MKHSQFTLCVGVVICTFLPSPVFAQSTLQSFHSGCDAMDKFVHPDCAAAIHRYCSAAGRGGAGISQEAGQGVFGVACFQPSFYGDVPLATLLTLHPGCNTPDKSRSPDCVSAVHRWCATGGRGGAGLVQEIGNAVFGVACFQPKSYRDVAINDLKSLHNGCDDPGKSQDGACVAAIHRWCNNRARGSAGLSQEVGNGVLGVACFDTTTYNDVPVIEHVRTEWSYVESFETGWGEDSMGVTLLAHKTILRPQDNCPLQDQGYSTNPNHPAHKLQHAAVIGAFLHHRQVSLLVSDCVFGKPGIKSVWVK